MKSLNNQIVNINKDADEGFSLIETAIALTTLGVCLAYAMPLFLYAKINNAKSEIRTGALIVSQRIFDDIRSKPFTGTNAMPLTDGATRDPATDSNRWITDPSDAWTTASANNNPTVITERNPLVVPVNINSMTDSEKLLTFAMGRQYRTKVTYCSGVTADNKVCTANSRKFKVEVSFNGSKVYDLEGNYTEFK
jgi:type II secretory pathway pseudopilin PulG